MQIKYLLKNEEATQTCAAHIAHIANLCDKHMIFFLYGDLGTGKTTFVQGFLKALGCTETVKSPTYTLVESYQIQEKVIYHFDFYRLENPNELAFIGIDDYFTEDAIVLVEWPEKAAHYLPKADVSCFFILRLEDRQLILKANTKKGKILLQCLLEKEV